MTVRTIEFKPVCGSASFDAPPAFIRIIQVLLGHSKADSIPVIADSR